MDNYNGNNQFQSNQNDPNQFMQNPNMQNPNMQNPNMQNLNMQNPNMQNMPNMQNQNMPNQFSPYQQPMQPNMNQNPYMNQSPYMNQQPVYQKPKSSAGKIILIIVLIALVVFGVGACAITACVGATLGTTVTGYVDKSKYSKDIASFDAVYTALRMYVADPTAEYVDGKTYTLSELIELDSYDIIASTLSSAYDEEVDSDYTFNCASEVFEGTTADDVKIQIDNGAVSIMIPANEKYADEYDGYSTGAAFK